MAEPTIFMPPQASTFAESVDKTYYLVQWTSTFFFVLIVGLMVFFVVRYRRRGEDDTTPDISHNNRLEVFWSALPALILGVFFFVGFNVYMNLRTPQHGAMDVYVVGRQWMWNFTYPREGIGPIGEELVVPIGKPVRLIMSSEDVLHSFFVPNFRVKQDVLPNRYTTLWFTPTQLGEHTIFCTEYCGTSHSNMLAKVVVKTQAEFDEWVASGGLGDISQLSPAELGKLLYRQNGCVACHSTDGSRLVGPTLKGVFGHSVALASGQTLTADEEYLRESIREPMAKVVQGYVPSMPAFPHLAPEQVNALVEYIKSLE